MKKVKLILLPILIVFISYGVEAKLTFEEPADSGGNIVSFNYTEEHKELEIDIKEEVDDKEFVVAHINCDNCQDDDNKPTITQFINGKNVILGADIKKSEGTPYQWNLVIKNKQDYESGNIKFLFELLINDITYDIDIYIKDIDDNSPVVTSDFKKCVIEENIPNKTGEVFQSECTYTVTDPDTNEFLKNVKAIVDSPSDDLAQKIELKEDRQINKIIYTLIVKESFDFEKIPVYFFNVRATDEPEGQKEALPPFDFPVIINVKDMPDEPPQWKQIFSTKQFPENHAQAFKVSAKDGDIQVNSPITYKIKKITEDDELGDDDVTIDPKTGEINVKALDRDILKNDILEYAIIAIEEEEPYQETPAYITFIIQDENDNRPEIENKSYTATIPETTVMNLGFKIKINDIDLGENSKSTVVLADPKSNRIKKSDAFKLIPEMNYGEWNTSVLVVNADILDYENPDFRKFTLEIIASDNVAPGEKSLLTITLDNRNDEVPIFQNDNYKFSQKENITKNTVIGTVLAEDKDVDDHVEYDLLGSNMKESFEINKINGEIRTLKDNVLDYEKTTQVILQIQAKDTLNTSYNDPIHTVFTTVVIDVVDVNDEKPTISIINDSITVNENVQKGTEIDLTDIIIGKDVDTTAFLEFSINWDKTRATKQSRDVDKKLFENCFEIKTIPDVNENSKDVRGTAYPKLIVKETTVKNSEGNDEMITLDYERYEYIYLSITVTDKRTQVPGKESVTASFTIVIKDLNDNAPYFDESIKSSKSVTETDLMDKDITIGTIIANDIDGPENNLIKYKLEALDEDSEGKVEIHEDRGDLIVKKGTRIDCDTKKLEFYKYKVSAVNAGVDQTQTTTAEIKIEIKDTNNKIPELKEGFKLEKVIELTEDKTEKTLLQTIEAIDRDRDVLFHTIAYFIDGKSDDDVSKVFSINRQTGEVFFDCKVEPPKKKCLDRDGTTGIDGKDSYTIFLLLRDNNGTGNTNDSLSFQVNVLDVNDNPPVLLDADWVNKPEDTETDSKIGDVNAIDIDDPNLDNSRVVFEIVKVYRQISEDEEEIDITSAKLFKKVEGKSRNQIEIWTQKEKSLKGYHGQIKIEIKATDCGTPPLEAKETKKYTFNVSKYNFEEPKFIFPNGTEVITLRKVQQVGSQLITTSGKPLEKLSATDQQEEKYLINFAIVSQDPVDTYFFENNQPLFTIVKKNENTAQLQLLRAWNSETESRKFKLTLNASHDGKGSANNFVVITTEIQFIDSDEEPYFDETTFNLTMTENCTQTKSFPPATDLKQQTIYYYLYQSDEYKDIFTVNHTSGNLTHNENLDKETTESFIEITIRASSNNEEVITPADPSSLLKINIFVEDVNDNPPKFCKPVFNVGISEKTETNTPIIKLCATDPDVSDEGKLMFRLLNDSITVSDPSLKKIKDKAFSVTPDGNILNLFKPLDGMKGFISFNVEVEDSPPYKHTAQALVKVDVISDAIRVEFRFSNSKKDVESHKDEIAEIFSEVIKYTCTIDDINLDTDDNGAAIQDKTVVKAHFMNGDDQVDQETILKKVSDYDNLLDLKVKFSNLTLKYVGDTNQNNGKNPEDEINRMTIALAVVTAILSIICVGLLTGCILKTRSLNRRLEAMNVPVFDITKPELEKSTGGVNVPGTNKHAVEANPVWNTDLKYEQFDNVSQGSGDSDLIGIEDSANFDGFVGKNNNDDKMVLNLSTPSEKLILNYSTEPEKQKKSLNPLAKADDDEIIYDDEMFA